MSINVKPKSPARDAPNEPFKRAMGASAPSLAGRIKSSPLFDVPKAASNLIFFRTPSVPTP
jgi:hypothetical protein